MHTHLSCIPRTTTCRHFVQVLVNHRWPCHAKNRSQHWENSRLDRSRFRHMPRSPVDYFMLLWFSFVQKGLFKILFNCKSEKSDDKVHQSWLSKQPRQCSRPCCTLLCCDPCVSLKPHTVTHLKLTVPPLQKSLIHIMNTFRKRIECWKQWLMKWTTLLTFSE